MPRGGWVGKQNTFTPFGASGVWTIEDVMFGKGNNTWPSGNFNVEVGSFTKATGVGNQDVTIQTNLVSAVAGTWAVVFWMSGASGTSGTWNGSIRSMTGFVANGGGIISEYAVCAQSGDGENPTRTARRMAAKCITVPNLDGNTVVDEASLTSFPTATSMRLNWTTASADAFKINYMIISGLTGAKVVQTSFTGTGDKSFTGVGFSPDLCLLAGTWNVTVGGSAPWGYFSLGAVNKHGQQWANSIVMDDAVAAGNTSRWQRTDACFISANIDEVGAVRAAWSRMDADGFTINYTIHNYDTRVIALCMDGISSKIGAFTRGTTTGSQTVATRQSFLVKGLLQTSVGSVPGASPIASALWSMGAYDGTNIRSVAVADVNTLTPTNADSVWSSAVISGRGAAGPGAQSYQYTLAPTSTTNDSVTYSQATADGSAGEELYLILGENNHPTLPATIHSQGGGLMEPTLTAYSNQKKLVQLSTGRLVAMVNEPAPGASAVYAYFKYSDDGYTWTNFGVPTPEVAGAGNASIDTYVDSGGTERIVIIWKQKLTGGGRVDGSIYIMAGTFSTDRSTITWDTAQRITDGTSTALDYPDVVCFAEGTGGSVHAVASYSNSTETACVWQRHSINSSGVLSTATRDAVPGLGIAAWGYLYDVIAVTAHCYPSIDYDPSTKRIFVAWSTGTTGTNRGIRFATGVYSATPSWAWTASPGIEVSPNYYVGDVWRWVNCRWDGTRVVIGGDLQPDGLITWESSSFTAGTFTERIHQASSSGGGTNFLTGSMVTDPATGDIYLFGTENAGSFDLAYRKFTRSTLSLGARVSLDYGINTGLTGAPVYACPITGGIGWIYTHGSTAPYAVKYDRINLS